MRLATTVAPYSVSMALVIVAEGARGETADPMGRPAIPRLRPQCRG